MRMNNVAIIEDEKLIADNLEQILKAIEPEFNVIAKIDSVEKAVEWLNHNTPDLIFLDIQLSDGLSFEIFNQVNCKIPVIFITAYDQYALKAFKVNSVDYLLKPINVDELRTSINKYKELKSNNLSPANFENLINTLMGNSTEYKKSFVVYAGEKIIRIKTDDVAYFYSSEKSSFLKTFEGNEYDIEYSLDKLETFLNPDSFFRISRKFIINQDSIQNMYSLSKSRIKIELSPNPNEEIFVSIARTSNFRKWLSR